MDFLEAFERERSRYEDGNARLDPGQLVRIGNAAYGAGLSLLMLGRKAEGAEWLDLAAERWRESWEYATPTSWGRPIGVIKAAVIAGAATAEDFARWTLELGAERAGSPIGRYAGTLALLVLSRWPEAGEVARTLAADDEFPPAVAASLAAIADGSRERYGAAVESVLESFESRDEYLEDVRVADTVLVLQSLARVRGLAVELRGSAVLPAS
ncbi:MAG TPA: hypothetical protein VH063_01450 [Gaiellaceae bacterium]|nr:hypothetical protein [Gaiellaceae bacterium]